MNIYFACSITGGREFEPMYQVLMDALLADGHDIPTAHLADSTVVDLEGRAAPREVYDRDVNWIAAAALLIAEVSVPSHGVGYEIGHALGLGKPVLCLAQQGRESGSISALDSFRCYYYFASKALMNMYTRLMAFDPQMTGIRVVAVHPGWVRTDMGGSEAALSPDDSACPVF